MEYEVLVGDDAFDDDGVAFFFFDDFDGVLYFVSLVLSANL